jgi:hypothetical protein
VLPIYKIINKGSIVKLNISRMTEASPLEMVNVLYFTACNLS